jgi:hypothetical protein
MDAQTTNDTFNGIGNGIGDGITHDITNNNTNNTKAILFEYTKITKVLENIQNMIDKYRLMIDKKIRMSSNEKDQIEYINKFERFISSIKNDPHIGKKYKKLKKRQAKLKASLDSMNSIHSANDVLTPSGTHDINLDSLNDNNPQPQSGNNVINTKQHNTNVSTELTNNIDDILHVLHKKYLGITYHTILMYHE